MNIEFRPLTTIDKSEVIELMNHPKLAKHMPFLDGSFDEDKYASFIKDKQMMWEKHGYGAWAFTLKDTFMGWGGLQPIEDDVEIALVLHPNFWGYGKLIYQKIIEYGFDILELESLIILLPPSRTRVKAIFKLGFKPDGEYDFSGKRYLRYRLQRKISDD